MLFECCFTLQQTSVWNSGSPSTRWKSACVHVGVLNFLLSSVCISHKCSVAWCPDCVLPRLGLASRFQVSRTFLRLASSKDSERSFEDEVYHIIGANAISVYNYSPVHGPQHLLRAMCLLRVIRVDVVY